MDFRFRVSGVKVAFADTESAFGGTTETLKSLHAAPVLAAHVIKRLGNLSQAAYPHGIHQFRKNVVAREGNFLQAFQCRGRFFFVAFLEIYQAPELRSFFFFGGPGKLNALTQLV